MEVIVTLSLCALEEIDQVSLDDAIRRERT